MSVPVLRQFQTQGKAAATSLLVMTPTQGHIEQDTTMYPQHLHTDDS
jgi:hypothetical protein